MSVFENLNSIDCSKHIEKKGKFNYLSWTWAWQTLKLNYPNSSFLKHTFTHEGNTLPFMKDAEGYAYVMVSVFVEGAEACETMPVLNHSNKPIKDPNSFDVNTAIQRTLVKAIAFHGLGLYIYAGEDINSHYEPEKASNAEMQAIQELINKTDTDYNAFCKFLNVKTLSDLDQSRVNQAVTALERKLNKLEEAS